MGGLNNASAFETFDRMSAKDAIRAREQAQKPPRTETKSRKTKTASTERPLVDEAPESEPTDEPSHGE